MHNQIPLNLSLKVTWLLLVHVKDTLFPISQSRIEMKNEKQQQKDTSPLTFFNKPKRRKCFPQ